MAEPTHAAVEMTQVRNNSLADRRREQRRREQNQESADSSGPIFSMYKRMAEREDNKIVDRCLKEADIIIIFTGLFSAVVAALISVTVVDLKQNPQDTSAFYLENMYKLQVLADPNISRPFIPSTPAEPPPFSPPMYVIWVNSLWFLSLAINLTCAMLATMLQQWARQYRSLTQPLRYGPHRRARMRAFFARGFDQSQMPGFVVGLTNQIQLSLLLFFSGLLIYLSNVDFLAVFLVALWVGFFALLYLHFTFSPIFLRESPYRTPLTGMFLCLQKKETPWDAVQKTAPKIDEGILEWTLDRLVDDHELEEFFETIPGFINSDIVDNPLSLLANLGSERLSSALSVFLRRTYWSNSLSESDKRRRFVIGVMAADAARLSEAVQFILSSAFNGLWDIILYSAELAELLKSRVKNGSNETNLCAQGLVALVIARMQGSDDTWVTLAKDQLGGNLPRYLQHGKDSVLLANLIHITRLIFRSLEDNRDVADTSSEAILPSLSKFDIRNALPELQHEFCALWNEIVSDVQNSTNPDSAIKILVRIRHLYIDLHQGTDAAPTAFDASTADDDPILCDPSSYRLCHLPDHRSGMGDDATGESVHSLATHTIPLPPLNPTHTTTHPTDESSSGEVPETSTRPIPVTTSSGPASRTTNIPSEASQDIAADSTTEVIADIPSPANPILQFQFTPARGAALQPNEETLTTTVSPAIVPGSLSSTPFLPAPSSALAGGLYLPTGPSVNGSGRIPHGPVSSSSSSTTAFPRVTPQVASSSGHNVTTAISSHSDVQGPNIPTLPELSRNLASDHPVTEET